MLPYHPLARLERFRQRNMGSAARGSAAAGAAPPRREPRRRWRPAEPAGPLMEQLEPRVLLSSANPVVPLLLEAGATHHALAIVEAFNKSATTAPQSTGGTLAPGALRFAPAAITEHRQMELMDGDGTSDGSGGESLLMAGSMSLVGPSVPQVSETEVHLSAGANALGNTITWTVNAPGAVFIRWEGPDASDSIEADSAIIVTNNPYPIFTQLHLYVIYDRGSPNNEPYKVTVSAEGTWDSAGPENAFIDVTGVNLEVGGLSTLDEETYPAVVLLNHNFDEGNHDSGSQPVPDNEPDYTAGHRIVATDPELIDAVLYAGGGGVEGEWRLFDSEGVMVWYHDGQDWVDATGQWIAVSDVTAVPLKVEGIVAGSFSLAAAFEPTGSGPQDADAVNVAVVALEILNAAMERTDTLRVAKLENSYDYDNQLDKWFLFDEFIDPDADRFFVRLKAAHLNENAEAVERVAISISTDNEDEDYNDNPTVIQLVETGVNTGIFVSQSQILVSNSVDDAGAGQHGIPETANILPQDNQNQGANDPNGDRTHKIALGGTLIAEFQAEPGQKLRATAEVPLDFLLTRIQFYILRDHQNEAVTTREAVLTDIRWANERLAQTGVFIQIDPDPDQGSVQIIPSPNGVDLEHGLHIVGGTITNEQIALFNERGTVATNDLVIFYVNTHSNGVLGVQTREGLFPNHEHPKHLNNLSIAAQGGANSTTFIHEAMHIMLNRDHDGSPRPYVFFLWAVPLDDVNQGRRITTVQANGTEQEMGIRTSPFVQAAE